MVGCGGAGQRLLENGTVNAQKSVRSLSPAWPTASAAGRIGGSTKSIQCLMIVLRNEHRSQLPTGVSTRKAALNP